jgi:tail assembly chaperone
MGDICDAKNWTPDAFWRCTPHEFMAIVEAGEERDT